MKITTFMKATGLFHVISVAGLTLGILVLGFSVPSCTEKMLPRIFPKEQVLEVEITELKEGDVLVERKGMYTNMHCKKCGVEDE